MPPDSRALPGLSTPEGRIAVATRWLVAHHAAPLLERVACATVIACAGDVDGECTFAEIAHYAGDDVTPAECMQALVALREQSEARGAW
jgi:hypothetical protein